MRIIFIKYIQHRIEVSAIDFVNCDTEAGINFINFLIINNLSAVFFVMSSSKSSDLFFLIQSMTKAEKRAFKLYAQRGSSTQHLFLRLFDHIDSADVMDDELIVKKMKLKSVSQFSNLKRHLYAQILSALRLLKVDKKPNIKIREYIDMAYVLYGKGLHMQALNILTTAKQLCEKYGTDLSLLTILEIEKNIHSRHITRLKTDEFETLLQKAEAISFSISERVLLTNIKINIHRQYIQKGHVKNNKELAEITKYFNAQIQQVNYNDLGIMEKIYYCQCYVWFHYVIEDYKSCLKYAKTWISIFQKSKDLQRRDYNLYLRGFHYGMISAFNLRNKKEHEKYLEELELFRKMNYAKFNNSNKVFSFLYVHTGRLNNAFLNRDYQKGLEAIPRTLKRLKRHASHLDQHKIMVLHYKIAWMYICAKKADKALPFLQQIISLRRKSLREDIQSYARLMHLIALYDLEDFAGILDILRKYKYYFKNAKERNELQQIILTYFFDICNAPIFDRKNISKSYLIKLKQLEKNKFEKSTFLYLDIIYWMEKQVG